MVSQAVVGGPVKPDDVRMFKYADCNEPGAIRERLLATGWFQRNLYAGDYSWFTHDYLKAGVERKRVDDLLGSIGDKLSRQLDALLESYAIRILLIEGSWQRVRPDDRLITGRGLEHFTWDMVWNYLRRWQDKGVSIELTINEGHTVHRLNELYALYQKAYSLSARSNQYTDERILAFPPGCRGKTGENALAAMGSLTRVANATQEALLGIPLVGGKKASLIYEHFHRGENGKSGQEEMKLEEREG